MIFLNFVFNLRRNILPNFTNEYLKYCAYRRESEPYCPIFLIGDIVKVAEPDVNEQKILLNKVNFKISRKYNM